VERLAFRGTPTPTPAGHQYHWFMPKSNYNNAIRKRANSRTTIITTEFTTRLVIDISFSLSMPIYSASSIPIN
jgi:hypothetical protein